MIIIKKIIYLISFTAISLMPFGKSVLAQCNTFDFPYIQNNSTLFFNCDSGEIQKINENNKLSPVPGVKSLGGFIHNFIWSPDGNKAFVLAENISAAMQTLEFYSSERELNSLNWWAYDVRTGKASLLDAKIVSIGWASDDTVVYNWGNSDLSIAKLDNSGLSDYVKLGGISNDSNILGKIISPVSMNNVVVFPMEKGFYVINSNKKEAKYYSLTGEIQKIIPDPFEQKFFIIKSGNYLYKFTVSDESLSNIDKDFSATDLAFFAKNSLVIAETDGKVFSYDIASKIKTPISLNTSGNISRVFSLQKDKEFIYTIGDSIYQKTADDKSSVLLLGKEQGDIQQSETVNSQNNNNKMWSIILIVVMSSIVAVAIYLIVRKKIIQR